MSEKQNETFEKIKISSFPKAYFEEDTQTLFIPTDGLLFIETEKGNPSKSIAKDIGRLRREFIKQHESAIILPDWRITPSL